MMATWVVGQACDWWEIGEKLRLAPFDCVVLVMSSWVTRGDDIYKYFNDLANGNPRGNSYLTEVLNEKAVYHLCRRIFFALHRAKIQSCLHQAWSIRSRGEKSDGLEFCSLHLRMDNTRQRMEDIKVGILDMRGDVSGSDVDALVEWLVVDRVAILTGFFGKRTQTAVAELAQRAGAILDQPLFQGAQFWSSHSQGGEHWAHPSYFLLFGFYRAVTCTGAFSWVPNNFELGYDITSDMIQYDDIPAWPSNDNGLVFVPNLGHIKMKPADFRRWCQHCFQTCVWLGTATPSKRSQLRVAKASKNKSKGKAGHRDGGKASKDKGKGAGMSYKGNGPGK